MPTRGFPEKAHGEEERYWGQGLATEGARAVVQYAFQTLRLDEIVAFTVAANTRSRRVMEKLGMSHNPAFVHVPELVERNRRIKGR